MDEEVTTMKPSSITADELARFKEWLLTAEPVPESFVARGRQLARVATERDRAALVRAAIDLDYPVWSVPAAKPRLVLP